MPDEARDGQNVALNCQVFSWCARSSKDRLFIATNSAFLITFTRNYGYAMKVALDVCTLQPVNNKLQTHRQQHLSGRPSKTAWTWCRAECFREYVNAKRMSNLSLSICMHRVTSTWTAYWWRAVINRIYIS